MTVLSIVAIAIVFAGIGWMFGVVWERDRPE